jgi:hypothetical protein
MSALSASPVAAVSAAPVALMPLPSLGTWHGSSQDLRKGLFVQELADGAEAMAEAWALAALFELAMGTAAH